METRADGTRFMQGEFRERPLLRKLFLWSPMLLGPAVICSLVVKARGLDAWLNDLVVFLGLGFGAGLFASMLIAFAGAVFGWFQFNSYSGDITISPHGSLFDPNRNVRVDLNQPFQMQLLVSEQQVATTTRSISGNLVERTHLQRTGGTSAVGSGGAVWAHADFLLQVQQGETLAEFTSSQLLVAEREELETWLPVGALKRPHQATGCWNLVSLTRAIGGRDHPGPSADT